MMADLGIAEIRAEGRRLAEAIGPEAYDRYIDYLYDNADVLLADPAPVGLTEKELRLVSDARELAPPNPDYPIPWDRYLLARLVAIIDRLSAAPVDDLEAYIDLALIRWVPGDDAGLARHIAESIHPRLVPVSPSVDPEEG